MPPPNPEKDESHQRLLDQLDMATTPRPFRNPNWRANPRRNKNVKQILSENSRKEASVLASQNNSGTSTPFPASGTGPGGTNDATAATTSTSTSTAHGPGASGASTQNLSTLVLEKNFRSLFPMGPAVTYTNIESAPSLHPASQKRYCDLTGLPAPYTDPKTRLRYHDREIFGVIRTLGQGVAESYLEARGAHVVLK